MSAPRVFKGREEEMTMEELAASGAAAKAKIAKRDSDDEEISLVQSDITASPAAGTQPAVAEAKKRKAGRPQKESRATKKLKEAVNPEAAVESSQSALPSAETSSSSYYGVSEPPSPTNRKIARVCKHAKTVPNQETTSVAQTYSCAQGLTQNGTDTNMRDGDDDNDDGKKGITPEPVSVPKKRGRPPQTKTPILTNTTDKGKSISIRRRAASARLLILLNKRQAETNQCGLIDSIRPTRISTRNNPEKYTPVKVPLAKAAPAKKTPTTHGRGVGRPKKTPRKSKSSTPQFTEKEYVVEKIVDSRIDPVTKEQMYMVKWKGYAAKDNTWEPMKNLGKCSSMIKTFTNSRKGKGNGKK
ncbi:chromo domain-containing protein [Colletotrichum incanum]|nr:chromo domain-containing protein [Colletotrichum incanum]